jgi:DNA integrity scanning protein DisA with diadenylate cyclase activity
MINGKDLALIAQRLDDHISRLSSLDSKLDHLLASLQLLEISNSSTITRVEHLEVDVSDLNHRSNTWNFTNSILAFIAGIVGFTRH